MSINKKILTKSTSDKPLTVYDCGTTQYRPMLDLQLELVEQRIAGQIDNTVLILEHFPSLTLGANKTKNILLESEENLADDKIDIIDIRRGGGATAHNPGQLVMYPILNLKSLRLGIADYIRQLEETGIQLLKTLDITAERSKGNPGLWIGEKKIASLGVKVKRHVTYHGIAINLNNDLSIFKNIVPCGIQNVTMTSAKEQTGNQVDIQKAKSTLADIALDLWA